MITGKERKKAIIRSFQKCEISLTVDGSENHYIHIKELDNYKVEDWHQNTELYKVKPAPEVREENIDDADDDNELSLFISEAEAMYDEKEK